MEKVKRPKVIEKEQKRYLDKEKYQEYAEEQFENIYDKLDEIVNESGEINTIDLSETITEYNSKIRDKSVTFMKSGNIYFLSGYFDLSTVLSQGEYYLKIPTEYAPEKLTFSTGTGGGGAFQSMKLSPSGLLDVNNYNISNWCGFSMMWIK